MHYAGFWLRAVALLIDALLLGLVNLLVNPGYRSMLAHGPGQYVNDGIGTVMILLLVIRWLYFTLTESSEWQATVGKMLLGIRVTDMNGGRISFGRANARFWSKIISALIIGIGFFMAGFTKQKQGLHDIIAKTLVVRK